MRSQEELEAGEQGCLNFSPFKRASSSHRHSRWSLTPDSAEITITSNYFIVCHNGNYTVREVDNSYIGEEYILINRKTGEYKVIDSARAIDIDW
jgi:hypothetical protein